MVYLVYENHHFYCADSFLSEKLRNRNGIVVSSLRRESELYSKNYSEKQERFVDESE